MTDAERELQLRTIEALHAPWPILGDCGHDHDDGDPNAIHTGYSLSCLDALRYWACRACCTDYGWQREDCGDRHKHTKDQADRCATARILAGAP